MDDGTSPQGNSLRQSGPYALTWARIAVCGIALTLAAAVGSSEGRLTPEPVAAGHEWSYYLPPSLLIAVVGLLCASAFFSGSETAFCLISQMRLRALSTDGTYMGRMIASLWGHPGRLLTTILVGNMIVNVLIAVLLGSRVEDMLVDVAGLSPAAAYAAAVLLCTGVIVFFGEISPKVVALRTGERFARAACLPLLAVDVLIGPIRNGLLRLTEGLFRVTRLSEVRAAPFITDDEFKAVLSESEKHGVLEQEEAQMIQGILEVRDLVLSEILIPRPDVVALPDTATVAEALEVFREHGCSRMPVYHEDMDHVVGVLFTKSLLPCAEKGEMDRLIKSLSRAPHFVPHTMSVYDFVRETQRLRTHLAIVVDEYGGTEGVVTLDDAIQEVVGEIGDEEEDAPVFEVVEEGVYRVEGGFALDELSDVLQTPLEDEEHETVAGFVMNKMEKIPEVGDRIETDGAVFTVEAVSGKRASLVRIEIAQPPQEGQS